MLGWEDPLEKRMATHSSILAWRIPWTILFHGIAKRWTQLSDFHFHFSSNNYYHFANLVSCRFSSANHPHHMHTHTHTHTYFGAFCGTSCFKESTSHHVISPVSTLYTLLIAKDCLKNHIYHSIYTKQNLQFFKYCLIAAKHLSFKLPLLSQRCIFTIGSFELGLI